MTSFAKNLLPKAAMVFASLLFTLALLEISARVLHLGSGGFWEPHPLYGWRNIPSASGWESCYGDCAVYVEMNSQGLRDEEISYTPAPGEKRVLVLGDSMTAGIQVPLEATFSEVLERELNARENERSWSVINAAVNGYGTDNELLFFRFEGVKYQPDYVLLGVYLANDVYNNSRELEVSLGGSSHKPYFELDERGELVLHNFPVEEADGLSVQLGSLLKRHFQLPRFIAETLRLRHRVPGLLKPIVELFGGGRGVAEEVAAEETALGGGDICDAQYSEQIERAWANTKALMRELRDNVEAQGAELIVVTIPASPQTVPPADGGEWYCDRPNEELAQFLAMEGIAHLDLLPAFREHALGEGAPLYFERDFHMNEHGHHLAGEELARFLEQVITAR